MHQHTDLRRTPRLTQPCAVCGADLVVRWNRHTGTPFVGCTRYPDCRYTTQVPLDVLLRATGAPELPLFADPQTHEPPGDTS